MPGSGPSWKECNDYEGMSEFSRGNKCQLMATPLLRKVTAPAVFVPEVAKQHDVFVRAIAL